MIIGKIGVDGDDCAVCISVSTARMKLLVR